MKLVVKARRQGEWWHAALADGLRLPEPGEEATRPAAGVPVEVTRDHPGGFNLVTEWRRNEGARGTPVGIFTVEAFALLTNVDLALEMLSRALAAAHAIQVLSAGRGVAMPSWQVTGEMVTVTAGGFSTAVLTRDVLEVLAVDAAAAEISTRLQLLEAGHAWFESPDGPILVRADGVVILFDPTVGRPRQILSLPPGAQRAGAPTFPDAARCGQCAMSHPDRAACP